MKYKTHKLFNCYWTASPSPYDPAWVYAYVVHLGKRGWSIGKGKGEAGLNTLRALEVWENWKTKAGQ